MLAENTELRNRRAAPNNSPFASGPAQGTRGSTSTVYIAPEFRGQRYGSVGSRKSTPKSSTSSARSSQPSSAKSLSASSPTQAGSVFLFPPSDEPLAFATASSADTAGAESLLTASATSASSTIISAPVVTAQPFASAPLPAPSVTAAAEVPELSPTVGPSNVATQPPVTMAEGDAVVTTAAPAAGPSAPPVTAAPSTPGTQTVFLGGDGSLAPPPFKGTEKENAEEWMSRFEKYATYRGLNEHAKFNFLAVLLRDGASDWLDTLEDTVKGNWNQLKTAFQSRFQESDLLRWQRARDTWAMEQAAGQSVDSYVTAMRKLAKNLNIQGEQLRFAIQRGLRPALLPHVIQAQPDSVDSLIEAARVAEAAMKGTASASSQDNAFDRVVAELSASRAAAEENTVELRKLVGQLSTGAKSVDVVEQVSPRPGTSSGQYGDRQTATRGQSSWRGRGRANGQQRGQRNGRQNSQGQVRQQERQQFTSTGCWNCGGNHQRGRMHC